MSYDDWKTTDPNEGEVCEDHRRLIPCLLCRYGYMEDRMDAQREEQS